MLGLFHFWKCNIFENVFEKHDFSFSFLNGRFTCFDDESDMINWHFAESVLFKYFITNFGDTDKVCSIGKKFKSNFAQFVFKAVTEMIMHLSSSLKREEQQVLHILSSRKYTTWKVILVTTVFNTNFS